MAARLLRHSASETGGAADEVRRAPVQPAGVHRLADCVRKGDAEIGCQMSKERSTRPYLIRAIYEWCSDSGLTPYLSVKVSAQTRVPTEFVKNGEIVLN